MIKKIIMNKAMAICLYIGFLHLIWPVSVNLVFASNSSKEYDMTCNCHNPANDAGNL